MLDSHVIKFLIIFNVIMYWEMSNPGINNKRVALIS